MVWLAVLVTATGWAPGAVAADPAPPVPSETVTQVEIISPQRLPSELAFAAIGDLAGRPPSRAAIRQSLERLWALGLFSEAWVDEVPEAGGVRLRFHLVRRPFVRSLLWMGNPGLSQAEAAAAAAIALGEDATPERLAQARIGSVRFHGTIRLPPAVLAGAFGLRQGDRYSHTRALKGVRAVEDRLRQAGSLKARVTLKPPRWDRQTNQVSVDCDVAEGPDYRIEFAGNLHLDASALRERLTLSSIGIVDEAETRINAQAVEAVYRDAGYPFARVSGLLEAEDETHRIRFTIVEGPRVTVESITFSGNQAFPRGRLRDMMQARPPGWLQKGLFRQEILDRDVLVLLAFYRSQGFPDAAVGPPEVTFSEDRQRARISIPVVEGPPLAVGIVTIDGALALSTPEVQAAVPLKPGTPWVAVQAEEARRLIQRLYAQRGYLGAQISVAAVRQDDRMSVIFRIQEGRQTRVGRILLSGLVMTDEQVIRREIPFHPGDPFNPEALVEAERRLAGLGLFERARVGPLHPPPAPFADVEVTLKEGKPWHVDLGGGYSTDQQWRGYLEVGHDNLFGRGRSATVRESLSTKGDRTDVAYREPWLFGTRWRGEAALLREHKSEIGFKREQAGGSVGIQRELFPDRIDGLRGGLRYRLDWIRRFEVDPALAAADVVAGTQLVASLTPSLTLDRRDSLVDPKRGNLHFVSLEAGGSPLGGEVNFIKSRLDAFWFLDWLAPTTIVLSGRFGLATPLSDTPALIIEDRFFAGGARPFEGTARIGWDPETPAGIRREAMPWCYSISNGAFPSGDGCPERSSRTPARSLRR